MDVDVDVVGGGCGAERCIERCIAPRHVFRLLLLLTLVLCSPHKHTEREGWEGMGARDWPLVGLGPLFFARTAFSLDVYACKFDSTRVMNINRQLLTMDLLALATMKNAVKCDM